MGLLGKTLAILNVLAAVGFLVVAIMDYGKQRAWSTLTFQQDLLIHGLPLDEEEKDFTGEVISKKIGPATLDQLQTGGQPVTNQVAEVKTLKSTIGDNWGGDEASNARRRLKSCSHGHTFVNAKRSSRRSPPSRSIAYG